MVCLPAIALPIMRAIEFGAVPQMTLASSKIRMVDKNVHLVLSKLNRVSKDESEGLC